MRDGFVELTDQEGNSVLLEKASLQIKDKKTYYIAYADNFTIHRIEDNDISSNLSEPWSVDERIGHDDVEAEFGWNFSECSEDVEQLKEEVQMVTE